jgi:hypothetical protein
MVLPRLFLLTEILTAKLEVLPIDARELKWHILWGDIVPPILCLLGLQIRHLL